jgi:beta-glucosidase
VAETSRDTDPDEAIDRLPSSLDLPGKVRLVTGSTFWTTQADDTLGLRSMVLSDGPVGVRGERWDERDPSATLHSPTALAATWDEPLVTQLGGLLAAEARRKGVDILLTPTVNLHRTTSRP